MSEQILELAEIKLSPESTEQDLLSASETFQKTFLDKIDGFLRRDMVRKADGLYLDVILWESQAHWDAAVAQLETSAEVAAYFSHMVMDPDNMEDGIARYAHLRSFSKGCA